MIGTVLRSERGDSIVGLRVTQEVEEISEAADVRCLLLTPRRFFVRPENAERRGEVALLKRPRHGG